MGDPLPAGRPRGRARRPAATCASRASRSGREFKSAADLEIIRRQDARAFAALYQQDPAEASQAEWAPELFGDWIWVPPEKWPQEFDLRVVCVDASKGRSDQQGDYSAIVFLGVGEDRLLYVDAILDRIPLDQIVRKTVRLLRREAARFRGHRGRAVPGVAGPRVPPAVRRAVRPALAALRDDDAGRPQGRPRIRRLSQYVINRELRFKADSPGCRLLVDQLMDFPLAEHDDGPDALEMCTRLPLQASR